MQTRRHEGSAQTGQTGPSDCPGIACRWRRRRRWKSAPNEMAFGAHRASLCSRKVEAAWASERQRVAARIRNRPSVNDAPRSSLNRGVDTPTGIRKAV